MNLVSPIRHFWELASYVYNVDVRRRALACKTLQHVVESVYELANDIPLKLDIHDPLALQWSAEPFILLGVNWPAVIPLKSARNGISIAMEEHRQLGKNMVAPDRRNNLFIVAFQCVQRLLEVVLVDVPHGILACLIGI